MSMVGYLFTVERLVVFIVVTTSIPEEREGGREGRCEGGREGEREGGREGREGRGVMVRNLQIGS